MQAAQRIVWVDSNHEFSHLFQPGPSGGNNQQLLLKISRDMSSSVEVEEYLECIIFKTGNV